VNNYFTKGDDFLSTFLANKQLIYLTTITKEFNEVALNWYLSLKTIKADHLALIVCADPESYEYIQKQQIPCVFLDCNIQKNITGEQWIENEKNFKLRSLYIIFKHFDVDIVFSDVDIIFLKDPLAKFYQELEENGPWDWLAMSDKKYSPFVIGRKRGHDVFVDKDDKTELINTGPTPQTLYGEENAGFSFIPNPSSPCRKVGGYEQDKQRKIEFLETFLQGSSYYNNFPRGTEAGCLQTVVNQKAKETHLRVKKLSCFEFPNGSVWSVPYIRKKIENECYIVHYNFCEYLDPLKVKEEKINRMKQFNHWYVT
jgi:hypothetical protein